MQNKAKEKDRKRKANKRVQMSEKELRCHQKANRAAVHRATKKSKKTTTPIKIFKTPQSLGKAKNRVKKFLPQSPRHKKELVLSLANDFGIECHIRQEIANGNKGFPQETVDKVKSYYLESSWTCPGRKDFVIVYENNKKEKKQKHYLLTKLKEAYSIFCNENPNFQIGFSKFCDLRPQQVKLMQDVPHSACLCSYHENARLLLVALNKHDKTIPTEFLDFIAKLVCNQDSGECMFGICCECPSITILTPEIDYNDISRWQWANNQNGKAEKQEFKGSLMDCSDILKQQSSYFLKHTYIKYMQSRAFISERESLKDDDSTVVIQVNSAENYTTQIQNAIQSSYWVSKQLTLFTVCTWEKNGCHSIVIASDYLSHNKYAELAFMSMLVDHLKHIREFNRYVVFSDGAPTQFKQKFTVWNDIASAVSQLEFLSYKSQEMGSRWNLR